jgi:hypothetical protein
LFFFFFLVVGFCFACEHAAVCKRSMASSPLLLVRFSMPACCCCCLIW